VRADESTILDMACGSAKHDGAFGLDNRTSSAADLVHDLRATPWPVPGDHYSRVFCQDIVEHVPDVGAFVRELHRVCAAGAEVEIRTPHFSSWYSYNDPTHVHSFGYFFLDHFTTEDSTLSSGGRAVPLSRAPLSLLAGPSTDGRERVREPLARAIRAALVLDVPLRESPHQDVAAQVAERHGAGGPASAALRTYLARFPGLQAWDPL
jgi:hypothetical protein